MNYSVQRALSDGSLVLLPISIEYYDRAEISVIFDDGEGTYDWEWVGTSDNTIAFPTAIPDGVEVLVRRDTDMSELRHKFTGGAAFTKQSLDEAFTQVLHIAQEAKEGAVLGEIFQNVDMHGYKMVNVGDGVDPTDGASVGQLLNAVQDITEQVGTATAAASTASAAATSASASATSAEASKTSAVSAASSAATSATSSADSAAAAGIAKLASEAAALLAESASSSAGDSAALASDFVNRYLGPKESPPSTDNSGGPLQVGQLYWDIYGNVMQVWSGTAWVAAYVSSGDYVTLAGVQTLVNKTLTSPTISANSTAPALTIVQTGTGDCLTVYDQDADTTRFIINANGDVGIGGTGVDAKLRLYGGNFSLDQTTGYKMAFNASDAFTSSAGTSTARYGLTYNALGATFNVGLSGWGGLGFYTTDTLRMTIGSAGTVCFGGSALGSQNVRLIKPLTSAANTYGLVSQQEVQSDVTSSATFFYSGLITKAATFTLPIVKHFSANQDAIGAGSTVTSQYGFVAEASLTGASTNYGFYGGIPYGAGRWNFYAGGDAPNYMAGGLGIGTTASSTRQSKLIIGGSHNGNAFSRTIHAAGSVDPTVVTNDHISVLSDPSVAAGGTLPNLTHFLANQSMISGAVTTQIGFSAASTLVGAGYNYGFYGGIDQAAGRYNFYAAGTADNYFNGKTTFNKALQVNSSIIERGYTVVDGTTVDLDPANGMVQQWTLGANRSPTASSFANGQSMTLMISDGTAYTVTWPSVTWVGGSAPALATTGWTIVELFKIGGVLYGAYVGAVA